jgi:hypothetical protein
MLTNEHSEDLMLKLHPEVLLKNGKKEFVVLPYKEFLAMQDAWPMPRTCWSFVKPNGRRAGKSRSPWPRSNVNASFSDGPLPENGGET